MNINKINRILHRDLGYLFFGMTIIYALSGIALNHLKDWNPSYDISAYATKVDFQKDKLTDQTFVDNFVKKFSDDAKLKKIYSPEENTTKLFIDNGSITIDWEKSEAYAEMLKRRPIFYQVNFLHYNPGRLWTYFSDFFCISLIVISITGLFLIKGKNSIKGRGAWLTALGILIPVLFLVL